MCVIAQKSLRSWVCVRSSVIPPHLNFKCFLSLQNILTSSVLMTPVSEDEDNVLKAFTVPKNRPLVGPLQVMTVLTFGALKISD